MNGKLDPEEHVMEPPTIIEQVALFAQKYGMGREVTIL